MSSAKLTLARLDADQYSGKYFYVPPRARWNEPWTDKAGNQQSVLKHTKENVGSMLNKGLEVLEENADALQDVLKGTINFNHKIGQNTLDDDIAYWFVANTDLFLKKTTESTHGTKRFDLSDLYKIKIGVPEPEIA